MPASMQSARVMLHIQLLGDFRVTYGDAVITTVNSPRLQSLLAYLVLHRDAPQSRQHLAFCLWSNSSESQARTNLRNLLHTLRQALPAPDRFLQSDILNVQWRTDAPLTLDVFEFENAAANANSIQTWQQAVELYRGDLLPSGYDDWILLERDRLRQKFMVALEQLGTLVEAEGDYASAIRHAQRLLQCEPLREETYCRLMRLHAMNGDRAGVVRVYNTCATVLQRELQVEPSVQTRQAYEHFLKMQAPPDSARRASSMPIAPRHSNLPLQLTSFVGREQEKNLVKGLMTEHRLITLTGAGGVGKTRLALAVAANLLDGFSDGVWWVDLAPLADPKLVPQQVASALGVREEPERALLDTLLDHVRAKNLALLLDNCEHVVESVGRLAETLLQAAPGLHILVTSRESLRIAGETTWRVPSLSLPRDAALESTDEERQSSSWRQCESVRLFLDRAAATLPTFAMLDANAAAIAQICSRLDGIPLAIELAAARVKVMSVELIAVRLDDCFRLLTGGRTALPRHQTLRETMDWSYGLLSEKERVLLRRLSVFAGGFTLEAAEAVCSDQSTVNSEQSHSTDDCLLFADILDLLSSLIDKSLVAADPAGVAARFRLHEITRQYARIELTKAGEEAQIRNRHLDFLCRLAEQLEPGTKGAKATDALNRLAMENDNLRAALKWSTNEPGDAQTGLRLAASLERFWTTHGLLPEGHVWLEKLLARAGVAAPPAVRAKALYGYGQTAYFLCDYATARAYYEQSLVIDRELDNKPGIAQTLNRLGFLYGSQLEYDASVRLLQECLPIYRSLGDPSGITEVLYELGYLALRQGNNASARSLAEECLVLLRDHPDPYQEGHSRWLLGHIALAEGKHTEARSHYTQVMTNLYKQGNLWGVFFLLDSFARLGVAENQFERAAKLFGATERVGEIIRTSFNPVERVEHERAVAATRAALGETRFAAARAEGRAMASERAVAYALEEPAR